MSKRVPAMIDAHATLTAAIGEAIKAALAAGLDISDVTAVLARYTEILEAEAE